MAKARQIPGLDADMPLTLAAARAVEVRAQELFAFGPEVLGTADIEGVHDMRVATRRLRAVLEIFAACFDREQHRVVLREIKSLADALGERRDPDVAVAALHAFSGAAAPADRPGIEHLADRFVADQRSANAALATALRDVETSELPARVAALVASARAGVPGPA